jgi:two-component system, chemotaxis family, CheB/CheR fusion protein
MLRKSGERFAAAGITFALKDDSGELIGFTKVMRDQTEKVLAEEARRESLAEAVAARQAVDDLNAELRENDDRLRRYGAELSDAAVRKNEFLAMLGHELRNPLSALGHGLELLGRVTEDGAQSERVRAMMARQTKRITTLLDQLLDIARVVSDKVQLSREGVDLTDVLRAAVETVRSLSEAQQHELSITIPRDEKVLVIGDPIRLTQVVENLLTNAIKYTDEGGQITLSLEADEEQARIIVADNGIGMSSELLPHIFDIFTQAPRTLDRSKGGLGLGLPLVKRLAEMHGGSVDVSSPGPGEGSRFVVRLPRLRERRAEERLGIASGVEPGKVPPRRILVVDDEKDTAESLAVLLEEDGHDTLSVQDGRAALDAVRTFDPEVVLLDLGLPDMNGYEVAEKLREEHPRERLLLIAVTGYQNDETRLKEAGFDHHLLKPPNMRKLTALLAAQDDANAPG